MRGYLKRITNAEGLSWLEDTRTPEDAAAEEAEHRTAKAAELGDIDSCIAYFDEDLVCRVIVEGAGVPDEPWPYSAPVKRGTSPNQVTYNLATGRANKVGSPTIKLPEVIDVGSTLEVDLPEGVVAEVNGERQTGKLIIKAAEAGVSVVELKGSERQTFHVQRRSYAEHRAAEYPPVKEQLDAFWKGGAEAEAMRAKVMAVKAAHPKPEALAKPESERKT